MLNSFKAGIRNLFKWFPIIWEDRDYDYCFLLEIIKFKISNMEQYFRKHGHHVHADRDANNMSKCGEVLYRIIEDNYGTELLKEHDKKWGKISTKFVESNKGGLTKFSIKRSNVKTKQDEQQERLEFKNCLKEESRLIKRDIDYIFDMLKKHIEEWWD